MPGEASGSGWPGDHTSGGTNNDEYDLLNFEAYYSQDTVYNNPVDAQHFGSFNQPFSTLGGTTPSSQHIQLPAGYLCEPEDYSWSDHSNFHAPVSFDSSNYGNQEL